MIDRIHELLDELADAVKAEFPDYSKFSVVCADDGYRAISVDKWGKYDTIEEIEIAPRRVLWDQTRVAGKWGDDFSQSQNKYYEKNGLLLKDDDVG